MTVPPAAHEAAPTGSLFPSRLSGSAINSDFVPAGRHTIRPAFSSRTMALRVDPRNVLTL